MGTGDTTPGTGRPRLEYVRRQYGQTLSGDYPRYARVRAMVSDVLYTDPVVYDWQQWETKALVIGGEEDDLADDFVARVNHVHNELPNSALPLPVNTRRGEYLISSMQI